MKNLFILIAIFAYAEAFAQGGSGVGNGGSGVVCYTGKNGTGTIISVQSRDLWEATHQTEKLKIDIGPNTLNEFEKVKLLIKRVKQLDSAFADELVDRYRRFLASYEIQNRVKIKTIDDTRSTIDPKGNCLTFQIAVNNRYVDEFFDKKFQFDASVWKLMSRNERAALIFHELIYWSEIDLGAEDSFGVRRIVGIFASTSAESLTLPQYIALKKQYLLQKQYRFGSFTFNLDHEASLLFDENGKLVRGKISAESQYELKNAELTLGYVIPAGSVIEFDSNGAPINDLTLISTAVNREYTDQIVRESKTSSASVLVKSLNREFTPQLESKQADGRYSVLNSDDPSIYESFTENGIQLENAQFAAFEISQKGEFVAFWVRALGAKAYIQNQRQINSRYELSWKPSKLYRIVLDSAGLIKKVE